MIEFVGYFVNRLFQEMSREKLPEFGFGFGKEVASRRSVAVSAEEGAADPSVPENRPGFQLRKPFLVQNAQFDLLE